MMLFSSQASMLRITPPWILEQRQGIIRVALGWRLVAAVLSLRITF